MNSLTFILTLDTILIAATSYNATHCNNEETGLYGVCSAVSLFITLLIALAVYS